MAEFVSLSAGGFSPREKHRQKFMKGVQPLEILFLSNFYLISIYASTKIQWPTDSNTLKSDGLTHFFRTRLLLRGHHIQAFYPDLIKCNATEDHRPPNILSPGRDIS